MKFEDFWPINQKGKKGQQEEKPKNSSNSYWGCKFVFMCCLLMT